MPDEPQEHVRKKRKQTTAWTGYIQALVRGNADTSSPRVPPVLLAQAPTSETPPRDREAPATVRSWRELERKKAGNRREVGNSQTSHPWRTTTDEPQASASTTSAIPSTSTERLRIVDHPPKLLPRTSRLGPSFIDSSRAHDDSPSSSLPKPRVGSRLLPAILPGGPLSTPGNDIPSASRGSAKPVAPPPLSRQSSDAPLNASVETASLARDQSTKEVAEISDLEESRKVEADHREPPDEPIEPDPGPEELFLSSDSDSRHSAELIEQILLSSPRSGKGQLLVPKEEVDEEKPDVGRGSPLKKGKKVVWLSSEGEEDAIMMGEERGEATEKAFEDDLIVSASNDKLALNLGTSSRASNPVDTASRANQAVTSLSQQQELPTRSPRKSNLARKSAPSPRSSRPPMSVTILPRDRSPPWPGPDFLVVSLQSPSLREEERKRAFPKSGGRRGGGRKRNDTAVRSRTSRYSRRSPIESRTCSQGDDPSFSTDVRCEPSPSVRSDDSPRSLWPSLIVYVLILYVTLSQTHKHCEEIGRCPPSPSVLGQRRAKISTNLSSRSQFRL